MYTGNWKGFLLTDTTNVDNQKGLPVTVFISDDNDKGELYGEMTIQYRYQTDIYKAKYIISGNYEEGENSVYLQQERLVYYDLLPKGLQWCFGGGNFVVYRNPYKKKNYMDGFMTTNCGNEQMRIVLVKK
ncbi:MAG: hypothetical protein U0X41_08860 [Chitinophagales bacterium]|jgi:hypothetical protein